MPKTRVTIYLDPETLAALDQVRDLVPRAAWIRQAVDERLGRTVIEERK